LFGKAKSFFFFWESNWGSCDFQHVTLLLHRLGRPSKKVMKGYEKEMVVLASRRMRTWSWSWWR